MRPHVLFMSQKKTQIFWWKLQIIMIFWRKFEDNSYQLQIMSKKYDNFSEGVHDCAETCGVDEISVFS